MFHLTYIRHELRRRLGRTILTSLGLALGVGLVVGITSVSAGLDDAQDEVLAPLSSVGTDILVTRVAGAAPADASATSTTVPARGGAFFRGGFAAGPGGPIDQEDARALLEENRNVVTDLAKLGKPGDKFERDFFLSATLISFPEEAIKEVASLPGVTSAVGGLVQLVQHQTGTVPEIVAEIKTGGETLTQTIRPDPMTDAERDAFRKCAEEKGASFERPAQGQDGGGGGGGRGQARNPAFDECLPQRFREFRAQFTTPLRTIREVIAPPSTDISNQSWTAGGVDPAHPDVGLVTQAQLTQGEWLPTGATNEVLVSAAYANTKGLSVGSMLKVNETDYKLVGLVNPTLTGSTADVYFPLATLQKLAGKEGRVTQVLVKADGASGVPAVASKIKEVLPGAEVVTTAQLAGQVTGSLADAKRLAERLGTVLSVIVLAAAFAIAVLLTLSSIAKRVREIGTLRAIGWSKRRVVGQLLGETAGIGLIGGVLGIVVGGALSLGIEVLSPSLSATTSGVPGIASSTFAGLFGQAAGGAARTTEVAISAPLGAMTLLSALVLAQLGGLLAGLAGGWRAARLAPAVSLRDLG